MRRIDYYNSSCDAFLMGYLAGMRREGQPIRKRESNEYSETARKQYHRGYLLGRQRP